MEKNENCNIPFLGDNDISNNTSVEKIAPWVETNDRIPLLLALSLYGETRKTLGVFSIMMDGPRAAAWIDRNTNIVVIGFKGTSEGTIKKDLGDDFIITTSRSYCNLSIVAQGMDLVRLVTEAINAPLDPLTESILPTKPNRDPPFFIFVGHSLGGTAAMCMTMQVPNSRGISFNGGASPTNPITTGPGRDRFTHYHIVGDLISTHMSEKAAKVIRIKIQGAEFGSTIPHSSGNLTKNGSLYTADQEDSDYLKWGRVGNLVYNVVKHLLAVTRFHTKLQTERVIEENPIPGSTRDLMQ
jgi:hypothetical protein